MLAKALSHSFESKLLLLDVTEFSLKVTECISDHSFTDSKLYHADMFKIPFNRCRINMASQTKNR